MARDRGTDGRALACPLFACLQVCGVLRQRLCQHAWQQERHGCRCHCSARVENRRMQKCCDATWGCAFGFESLGPLCASTNPQARRSLPPAFRPECSFQRPSHMNIQRYRKCPHTSCQAGKQPAECLQQPATGWCSRVQLSRRVRSGRGTLSRQSRWRGWGRGPRQQGPQEQALLRGLQEGQAVGVRSFLQNLELDF